MSVLDILKTVTNIVVTAESHSSFNGTLRGWRHEQVIVREGVISFHFYNHGEQILTAADSPRCPYANLDFSGLCESGLAG